MHPLLCCMDWWCVQVTVHSLNRLAGCGCLTTALAFRELVPNASHVVLHGLPVCTNHSPDLEQRSQVMAG